MSTITNPKYMPGDIVIGNSPKKGEYSESRVYMGTISYANYNNGWEYHLATIGGTWLCDMPESNIITLVYPVDRPILKQH